MRAVELAGPLPHPHEVPGHVVGLLGPGVDPGQRLLVVQDEHLVPGVQVHALERLRVDARRVHERHGPVDLAGHPLVLLARRVVSRTKSWFHACTWRRSA